MEYRASKDIKKFLDNFALILDLNKNGVDEIIDDIVKKILEMNEAKAVFDESKLEKITLDQVRSALFTHDQGKYFKSQHIENFVSLSQDFPSILANYSTHIHLVKVFKLLLVPLSHVLNSQQKCRIFERLIILYKYMTFFIC